MQLTSFIIQNRRYYMSFEKIDREVDLHLYWGTIHLSKPIQFSCIKIDDKPLFITTPVTLSLPVEEAILQTIQLTEQNNLNNTCAA